MSALSCARYCPERLVFSQVRRLVPALGRQGENLHAGFGDTDRMLELGRQRTIAGDRGPAVAQHLHAIAAQIDHGLDGEEHAGLQGNAAAGLAVMDNVGQGVEHLAQAVATEVAHHGALLLAFGIRLDGIADVAGGGARLHRRDAAHHGFIGDLDQPFGPALDLADRIHARGVAMPAVQDDGDVNVHDIAVAQRLVVGNAVADHMVDGGADGVAIAAIVQAGRGGAMGDDVVISGLVQGGGGDTRFDQRHQQVQHLGGQPAGPAHTLEIGGIVHRNREMGLAGGFENLRLGQDGHGRGNIISESHKTKVPVKEPLMPETTAAVLVIGDEILSGRTQDTNTNYIARFLAALGIDLKEVRVVGDVEDEIVAALNALSARYDCVFTTGGIGPTHDDITADAVAKAFGVGIGYHPDAYALLEARYPPGAFNDARKRMARVPHGAVLVAISVSGAPGFHIGNVYVLAGVPMVMRAMMEGLAPELPRGRTVQSITVEADIAEGVIAPGLAQVQKAHKDVAIGSYPFYREGSAKPFGAQLVVRGRDATAVENAALAVEQMLRDLGAAPQRLKSADNPSRT